LEVFATEADADVEAVEEDEDVEDEVAGGVAPVSIHCEAAVPILRRIAQTRLKCSESALLLFRFDMITTIR
jgi:hypothetical protein